MKIPYGEGLAICTGPEPCAASREVGSEALARGDVGWVLSRESAMSWAPTLWVRGEGNTVVGELASPHAGPAWSQTPSTRRSSLHGNWDISRLAGRPLATPVRIGKARSRSR